MLVQYNFTDTMSHDKETNADVALANTFLVTKPVPRAKQGAFFGMIQIRISDPRSLGSCLIK